MFRYILIRDFLIISFLIRDPYSHPVGWWSSMSSSFNLCHTFKKSSFFCNSTSSAYSFNLLYYVMFCCWHLKLTNRLTRGIYCWLKLHMGLTLHATSVKVITIVASTTKSVALPPMTECTIFVPVCHIIG